MNREDNVLNFKGKNYALFNEQFRKKIHPHVKKSMASRTDRNPTEEDVNGAIDGFESGLCYLIVAGARAIGYRLGQRLGDAIFNEDRASNG